MRRRGTRIVVGLVAGGIVLAVLADVLRLSPEEEIEGILEGCCGAAQAGNAEALVAPVAGDYAFGGYDRAQLTARFAELLERYPVQEASLRDVTVELHGPVAHVAFRTRVRVQGEGMLSGGTIDWEAGMRRVPPEAAAQDRASPCWRIERLAAVRLNGQALPGGTGLFEGY